MERLLWICIAGAAGSGARYLLSGFVLKLAGGTFPYGTLAVNLIGSFLLGAVMHLGLATEILSPTLRIVLATGLLGGFTTFSAFSYETLRLFQEGAAGMAALNALLNVAGCIGACFLGFAAARVLAGG